MGPLRSVLRLLRKGRRLRALRHLQALRHHLGLRRRQAEVRARRLRRAGTRLGPLRRRDRNRSRLGSSSSVCTVS